MKIIKTLLAVILGVGFIGLMFWFYGARSEGELLGSVSSDEIETIRIWYTDEALTDYLQSASVSYLEEYGVRVVPELHSGLEYMEEINAASLSGEDIPDLYILGTEYTEKAAMTGIAVPALDRKNVITPMNYPVVALDSVTYHNETFGYPFYYETAFMLYNQSYLREMADRALRREIGQEIIETENNDDTNEESNDDTDSSGSDGESADGGMSDVEDVSIELPPEGYTEDEWNVLVEERMQQMLPTSIEDILGFANTYATPDNVENIFLWDVNDIFYNYYFTGSYMDVGGQYGDDPTIVNIYNDNTVQCMTVYQGLNQFFSIDSKESSYESVLDTFLDGKTIFMIATTDAVPSIVEAQHDGRFHWDYSVTSLPGVDSEHTATGLSSTNAVFVNGYSKNREEADSFARYVTVDYIDSFFSRTGKLSAANGKDDYIVDATDLAREMYKESVSLPKLLQLSSFWVELELAYIRIWNGADPDEVLSELQEKIQSQVSS